MRLAGLQNFIETQEPGHYAVREISLEPLNLPSPDALHSLLGTNAVPDATQTSSIVHSIQNLREALQPIDDDALVLGTAVSQIHREVAALDAMLKKCQAVFMGPSERFDLLTDLDFRPMINPFFTTCLRPDIRLTRLDFRYRGSNDSELQPTLTHSFIFNLGVGHPLVDFDQFLYSDRVPDIYEGQEISAFHENACHRLAQLKANLNVLTTVARHLNFQRNQVSSEINARLMLLAPINRLPGELLAEIFVHSLTPDMWIDLAIDSPPLILGRVCKLWHSVTLSTPRLWSSIRAVLDYENPAAHKLKALSQWLGRAGVCPLSLSLSPKEKVSWSAPAENLYPEINLQTIIAKYLNRWQRLDFKNSAISNMAPLHYVGAPNLMYLTLVISHPSQMLMPNKFTRLKSLDFAFISYSLLHLDQHFHLGDLTSLTLRPSPLQPYPHVYLHVLEILAKCPKLLQFEFEFWPKSAQPDLFARSANGSRRVLTKLTTLIISNYNPDLLLNGIAVPSLTHLQLTKPGEQVFLGGLAARSGLVCVGTQELPAHWIGTVDEIRCRSILYKMSSR